MRLDWQADILGDGFEAAPLALRPDAEGDLWATLVRRRREGPPRRRAALYVHGYNDYFFQRDLAHWFSARDMDFYALDLRRHGRSLRADQIPNYSTDLSEYHEDLDVAWEVMASLGHERLMLFAHSTGGLIGPLWAARRPGLPLDGIMLNSPFLEFRQPAVMRALAGRAASVAARYRPTRPLPGGTTTFYGDSIHADRRGEWSYDLALKPSPGFPVRLGWVRAVIEAHRTLHAGLDQRVPQLVLCSTRTVPANEWSEDLQRGDAVLDADSIARWAPALGRHVTVVRVEGALHDVLLSGPAVREQVYGTMETWYRAWVA